MNRQEVKELIRSNGVMCWEVADELGMQDSGFSRMLRKPIDEKQVEKIKAAIEAIKSKK